MWVRIPRGGLLGSSSQHLREEFSCATMVIHSFFKGDKMPPVTVYTQPGCAPCAASKRKLTKLGIPFTEKDVSVDFEAREEIISLGFQQTPVVKVGESDSWAGYRPDRIEGIKELATTVTS